MSSLHPAVIETHTSLVHFGTAFVFKTKKPVNLGFVDFTTLAARRAACEREVALNRRLAPDVYLGVRNLRFPDGRHEPAVVMRRLPSDRCLAALLTSRDPDVVPGLDALARQLGEFHARCPADRRSDSAANPRALRLRWEYECGELDRLSHGQVDGRIADEIRILGLQYLSGRERLFEERLRHGYIRDGHGDLQAADIFLLPQGPRAIDCLEFDDALRIGDVLADIAFLVMDLERLDAPDLGAYFLQKYQAYTAEAHPPSLLHFYVAYRALIRAKVALIRQLQTERSAQAEVEALIAVCIRNLRLATVRAVCVGGLPGSGKTTVANGVALATGAVYLSTDELRDEGAPVEFRGHPRPAAWQTGRYAPDQTDAVYRELIRRAGICLRHGYSVVLDGSWRTESHRKAIRLAAQRASVTVDELLCVADERAAHRRLDARTGGYSDADAGIHRSMRSAFDAWPAAVQVATTRSPQQSIRDALTAIGAGTPLPPSAGSSPVRSSAVPPRVGASCPTADLAFRSG